ncbi:hypothetical protein GGS20DRAFT_547977 [Poronia punctata]|nr:hypothetical protein GGS20DRAFT_547977 [Poronia punctata]
MASVVGWFWLAFRAIAKKNIWSSLSTVGLVAAGLSRLAWTGLHKPGRTRRIGTGQQDRVEGSRCIARKDYPVCAYIVM